jgi:DnaJ like chaperone protein
MFLEIQVQAALADGVLDREEEQILLHSCQILGVSRFEFERLKIQIQAQQRFYNHGRQQQARVKTSSLQDAYVILGIDVSASDAEVKKAYRQLMNQNHPDKLVAKGLPEEMMTLAKEKTQKISKAYDLIQKSRK